MYKKKQEKLKEEQFWSTFYFFNLPKNKVHIPPDLERVNFRIWNYVNDEHLLLMMSRVKSINYLDLDETDITNEGVKHLTQLHHIKELRLKGIRSVDDDCMQSLNKLKGLELLHLGGTSVTLNGLTQLGSLQNLRVLLLSLTASAEIREKMLALKKLLPGCEFILNYKSYLFDPEPDEL